MNDPQKQLLIEIFSGHGNSEEYRDWRAVTFDAAGQAACARRRRRLIVPCCWQAGEIIEARCRAAGLDADDECESRAAEARQNYADAGIAGHLTVPGARFEDWKDCGQCTDCFIPAFNYRPGGSTQYALAISNFDDPAHPKRFRFGFIASSDNHSARPGTGYKEFDRHDMTESVGRARRGLAATHPGQAGRAGAALHRAQYQRHRRHGVKAVEVERQASFFMTGGLVAVHAEGRSRDAVWAALKRKEVYGTSGDRILLWFDLLNAPAPTARRLGAHGWRRDAGPRTAFRSARRRRVQAEARLSRRTASTR